MAQTLDLTPFLDELNRYNRAFSDAEAETILRFVGGRVGAKAEELAGGYPPQIHNPLPLYYNRTRPDGTVYQSKFKTAKQQRYVMALAARGGIPSKRSVKLGQSITSEVVSASASGATVAVGTNIAYGPYVIGKEMQSHYHRGNWIPLEDRLFAGQDQLLTTAQNALFQQAERILGG